MFCINVMINLLLVAICATIVTGSDVWMALYSAEECLDSALLQDAVVAEGECVVGTLSDGSEVSLKFACSGTTEHSSWSAGVYYGSSCFGFKIMTLSADDACTCGSTSVFGYSISAYASCAGTVPDCFLSPEEPTVWGAVYAAAGCESDSLVLDTTVKYGDCIGGELPDGTTMSSKFVCHGHTADSSWETGIYLTDDCTGFKVLSLGAADSCTCASTSLLGYADVSAYANCEGVRPDCFEKYPVDDKYDDATDTPVTVSIYSATACSTEDEVGTVDTVNGQDGCVSLSTSLGEIGLVVYCGEDDASGDYTYRADMFSSANCSGDIFTSSSGTADSCLEILGVGSFEVSCAHDNSGDPSSNGGTGDNSTMGSAQNILLISLGLLFLIACMLILYKCYSDDVGGKKRMCFSCKGKMIKHEAPYEDL